MMSNKRKNKGFIDCFSNFMSNPEGLTQEDLVAELKEQGINTAQLEKRVTEIVKRGSEERRLAWLNKARKKRVYLQNILDSKQITGDALSLKDKIREILSEKYGQDALSYAEAYFRKKGNFTEKDIEGLIEDLEDLNLLDEQSEDEV